MQKLTKEIALNYLTEASKLNPGPWVEHSKYVAQAARNIAKKLKLDYEKAEIFGLIHDVGRRFGKTHMKHTIDGYHFFIKEGFPDAAKICLTHSFPAKSIGDYAGKRDCSEKDHKFMKDFISKTEYDIYDRLIQLCDSLALPSGFTIVERRLIDVAIRKGINENSVNRWKAYLEIQKDIEKKIGCSVYSLLPGIEENLKKPIDYL